MPLVSSFPPRFSKEEVKRFIAGFYNLTVTVNNLVSDIGQNFQIADQSGNEFVFKISNPEENKEMLDMQNKAMGYIAVNNKSINSPRVYKTVTGEEIGQRFSESDNFEKAIDESLSKAEALRQSILKQAFEVRLV